MTLLIKNKLDYIDYFRAWAILIIVACHTLVPEKSAFHSILLYLLSGGSFFFIFISGYLFQYLSYKFDYETYLVKKIQNIIVPFCITMIPTAYIFALSKNDVSDVCVISPIVKFLICFIEGQVVNMPMWFIGVISIFFLFAPLFLSLQKSKPLFNTIFLVSVIYSVCAKRPHWPENLFVAGVAEYNMETFIFYILSFVYFLSFYLLGILLCNIIEKHYDFIKKYLKKIMIISFICILADLVLRFFILNINVWYYHSVRKFFEIFFIMAFFMNFESFIKSHEWLDKTLKFLANYSFGIFFIHYPIRMFIEKYQLINSLSPLYYIKLFVLVIILSLYILWAIKKILNYFGIKNTRIFIGVN